MKPWYRSLTIWSLFLILVGSVLRAFDIGGVTEVVADDQVAITLSGLLEALGLLGALVGRARASVPLQLRPAPDLRTMGEGFARLHILLAVALAGTLVACLGLLSSCAGGQRCPDGDGVVIDLRVPAPARLSARCSSDADATARVALEGSGRAQLATICPAGSYPGPDPSTARTVACRTGECTSSILTCVPSR